MQEAAPEPPLIPPLALAVYIAIIAGASALTNCAVVTALLKHSKNGLFSIIIQLAITDTILLSTSIAPELWSCNSRTWDFGKTACVAYQGLNVFTTTASLYFIITTAFHTLASVNVEETARKKRSSDEYDEEMRSSRHSLVANSDSSTPPRTMNIDYRLMNTKVPVTLPILFVWLLSASLSVPEFTLATVTQRHGIILCGLVESNHHINIQLLLAVFNLILPILIMITACTLIIMTLKTKFKLLQSINLELVAALKLSLALIIVYGLFCIPRSIVMFYVYWKSLFSYEKSANFTSQNTITAITLASSSAYLMSAFIRPLLCIFLLPCLRKIFLFKSRSNSDVEN